MTELINRSDDLNTGREKLNKSIKDASDAKENAIQALAKSLSAEQIAQLSQLASEETQKQLDNVIIESGTSDAEVIQARGKHDLLYKRLNSTDEQLAETEIEINNQRLNFTSNPAIRPLVTFVDDDGSGDVYTKLKPIFESRGVPLTIAIMSTHNFYGRLSLQRLHELQNDLGWEIASHSRTHRQLNDLSIDEKEEELKGSLIELKALGLNVKHIVYPFGYPNSSTRAVARKYYKSGLDSQHNGVMGTNSLPIKQYSLNRLAIGSYSGNRTLDDYKQAVDKAIAENSWLIFMTHIGETDEQGVRDIENTLDYIISKNVDVVTLDDGFEVFGNTLFQGDFNGNIGHHEYNIITKSGLEFKNIRLLDIDISSTIDKFPYGDSNKRFHRSDNSGFPGNENGAGNLFTHRSNDPEPGFSYQIFNPYRTNEIYRRYTVGGGNWSDFERIDYRSGFDNVKFYDYNKYTANNIPIDFERGKISINPITHDHAEGLPNEKGGRLITTIVNGDYGFATQEFIEHGTTDFYVRRGRIDGSGWTSWAKVATV